MFFLLKHEILRWMRVRTEKESESHEPQRNFCFLVAVFLKLVVKNLYFLLYDSVDNGEVIPSGFYNILQLFLTTIIYFSIIMLNDPHPFAFVLIT